MNITLFGASIQNHWLTWQHQNRDYPFLASLIGYRYDCALGFFLLFRLRSDLLVAFQMPELFLRSSIAPDALPRQSLLWRQTLLHEVLMLELLVSPNLRANGYSLFRRQRQRLGKRASIVAIRSGLVRNCWTMYL